MKTLNNRRFISILLLLETFLASLFFEATEIYLLGLTWATLVLWVLYEVSTRKQITLRPDMTVVTMLAFLAWMTAALTWHPAEHLGLIYNWRLALFPISMIVVIYLLDENSTVPVLLWIIGIITVIALLSAYQSDVLGEQARGLFYNKNNNGALLNLALLPAVSAFIFSNNNSVIRWIGISSSVLIFYALLQISSRGALLSFAGAMMFLLALGVYHKKFSRVVIIMVAIGAVLLMQTSSSTTGVRTDLQSTSRWYLYESTVEMISDAAPVGAGNGMWSVDYPKYRNINDQSASSYVHNDYMQLLYELGVPGLFFPMLLVFALLGRSRRLMLHESSIVKHPLHPGLLAGLAAVSVHSLVTFNFYLSSILLLCAIYAGMLIRDGMKESYSKSTGITFNLSPVKVATFSLVLIYIVKDVLFIGYADAMSRGITGTDIAGMSDSDKYQYQMKLWKYAPTSPYYPAAAAWSLAMSGEGKSTNERHDIYYRSLTLLHQAVRYHPYTKGIYVTEAKIVQQYKDVVGDSWREQAIALAKKDLAQDPYMVVHRLFLAKLLADAGEKEEALQVMLVRYNHRSNVNLSYYYYGKKLARELGNDYVAGLFDKMIKRYDQKHAK